MLHEKGNDNFLVYVKSVVGIKLTQLLMTMSYKQSLGNFSNEANRKLPPQMRSKNHNRRKINELRRKEISNEKLSIPEGRGPKWWQR